MKTNHLRFLIFILLLAAFLRFYNLASNPPAPYWEEVALGYDAYSILKTGKDFHGTRFPIVAFESFGDWKPSLYFYATVPSIAIFGLNVFAVRFNSALFGTLTVLLVYLLTKELVSESKKALPLLSAFLLAISPWHLQFSRAAFEANLGLFLIILGLYLFLRGLKNGWLLALSSIVWALSLYAYHANRLLVPLLGAIIGLWFMKSLWKEKLWTIFSIFLFVAGVIPIFLVLRGPQIQQRFAETSALATVEPVLQSNKAIAEDGGERLAKIIHHRFWYYLDIIKTNYLSHFDFDFLFLKGDINPRHSTRLVGNLYLSQLPFLILGIFYLFYKKNWRLLPLLFLLFLSPIPPAFTKATPHALRNLPMVIPLTILSSYGAVEAIKGIKNRVWLFGCLVILSLILSIEFARYLFIYHLDYPKDYSEYWQYGYKQMIDYVSQNKDKYKQIYITRQHGRPSMYYWFYEKTDPQKVQISKDKGEILEFENIKFEEPDELKITKPALLIVGPDREIGGNKLLEIKYLNEKPMFIIYDTY